MLTYSSATYRATNTYYNIFHKTNDPAASFGLFSFLTASVRCDPLGELHSLILPVISTAATNQCHKKIGVIKKRKKKDLYPPKKIIIQCQKKLRFEACDRNVVGMPKGQLLMLTYYSVAAQFRHLA